MIKQESKKKNKKREEKATNGTGIEEMKITKKYKQLWGTKMSELHNSSIQRNPETIKKENVPRNSQDSLRQ